MIDGSKAIGGIFWDSGTESEDESGLIDLSEALKDPSLFTPEVELTCMVRAYLLDQGFSNLELKQSAAKVREVVAKLLPVTDLEEGDTEEVFASIAEQSQFLVLEHRKREYEMFSVSSMERYKAYFRPFREIEVDKTMAKPDFDLLREEAVSDLLEEGLAGDEAAIERRVEELLAQEAERRSLIVDVSLSAFLETCRPTDVEAVIDSWEQMTQETRNAFLESYRDYDGPYEYAALQDTEVLSLLIDKVLSGEESLDERDRRRLQPEYVSTVEGLQNFYLAFLEQCSGREVNLFKEWLCAACALVLK